MKKSRLAAKRTSKNQKRKAKKYVKTTDTIQRLPDTIKL